jgi:putative ABC transport system permease protein
MWIKNFRHKKLQTVMIFLIIAICTILLSGSISILTSLEEPYHEFSKSCNAATAKVFPYVDREETIRKMGEQFLMLNNVRKVAYARSHYVNEPIFFNGKKAEIFTDLTEYNEEIFGSAYYLEGSQAIVKTLANDECILPACISNEFNIHTGDQVTVQLVDREINYRVAGVFTDPYQTSTAFDSDILINKLPEVGSKINIYVYGHENVTGKQIEGAYREAYDGRLNGFMFTIEERTNNGLFVGRIIGAVFLSIGIIMLLVSGLMIRYMIRNLMITDAKSISIFKTMGYTSNDIMSLYMKMYFTVVTLACLVGIFCSVFVSDTILSSIFENMGQLKARNPLLSGIICYVMIVTFVISVIAFIIKKTRKIKPVHALNGMEYGGIKKQKKYKGNSDLQFSPVGIAFRSFIREKRNAIGIIVTCIVTIFSVNFIVISLDVANSMKENNDFWIGVDKSDVMINITDSTDFEKVIDIVENDDRTDYLLRANYQTKVTMDWQKGMDETDMDAFVYDDYTITKLPVSEGRNPKAGNEIAISTTMAKALHKSVGDYLKIYLNENKSADMLITGLFQSYLQFGSVCRLITSAYEGNNCELTFNTLSVYLKNKTDIDSYLRDMKDKIGGSANVIRRTEQFSSIMDMIMKPQQKAIPPVAVLIIIIAGLNIFSIVYLKNMKSQKINGIYKSIGYTTWHLIYSNLYYVAAIALVCILITFPMSILTYSPILRLSLSMFHFMEYPVTIDLKHMIAANIAVFIIFISSTLASSRALLTASARDLVQE